MVCVLFWGICLSVKYIWDSLNSVEETPENERDSSDGKQKDDAEENMELEICQVADGGKDVIKNCFVTSVSRHLLFCLKLDEPKPSSAILFHMVSNKFVVDKFKPVANVLSKQYKQLLMNMSIVRQRQYRLQFRSDAHGIYTMVFSEYMELHVSNRRQYVLNAYRHCLIESSQGVIFMESFERIAVINTTTATERVELSQIREILNYTCSRSAAFDVIRTSISNVREVCLPALPAQEQIVEHHQIATYPAYGFDMKYVLRVALPSQKDTVVCDHKEEEKFQSEQQVEDSENEEINSHEAIGSCTEEKFKKSKSWKLFDRGSRLFKKKKEKKGSTVMINEKDAQVEPDGGHQKSKKRRFRRILSSIFLPCRK